MVVGVTEGYRKSPGDRRHRLPRRSRRARTSSSRSASRTRSLVPAPEGITFTVERPTLFHVAGHRQAAGRRGRREHPQDPPAGAVQGQGRASTRARSSAARPERQVRSERHAAQARAAASPRSAPIGRARRHFRVRKNVNGTAERPRLVVTRSLRHITAQIVDDTKGHTLASASSLDASIRGAEGDKKRHGRPRSARCVAERAKAAGVSKVVFDRGGNRYAGRIAALADAAREAGLEF